MSSNTENNEIYFVGVDVGTGSVRAALVNVNGKVVKVHVNPIKIWTPKPDFYEQSSDDIWKSCITCIKNVVQGVPKSNVKGIGFDATCSLVGVAQNGDPVSLSPTGNDEQNIILWMDHRASVEAKTINDLQHSVLKYVGGKISLEMETPKLLWLKNNLPDYWERVSLFFDLPDYLTWRATGSLSRSSCSLVCKWTYEIQGDKQGWNADYFRAIGLSDITKNNYEKIGSVVLPPGTPVGNGLKPEVAIELNLLPKTPVGTSIIDAHAGGLGMVGCSVNGISPDFHSRIGLICGTSTCHMAVSTHSIFTEGVWGPYYNAMVPGMWLNEGGQSATGKLLDHIIETHPATPSINAKLEGTKMHIQEYLSRILQDLKHKHMVESVAHLTKHLHVWPDFHGNRSPIADSSLKGMISGLTLIADEENLALLYLATIQSLAYGTRHIIESLQDSGYKQFETILICGGLSKNPIFVQTQADVANLPVLCPHESESVLLGSAILAACASRYFHNVTCAIQSMGGTGDLITPDENTRCYHEKKYKVFLEMYKHQLAYRDLMM